MKTIKFELFLQEEEEKEKCSFELIFLLREIFKNICKEIKRPSLWTK